MPVPSVNDVLLAPDLLPKQGSISDAASRYVEQMVRQQEIDGRGHANVRVGQDGVEAEIVAPLGSWGQVGAWGKRMWNGAWAAAGTFSAAWGGKK